ncbi:hypothetical protein TNCV_4088601 [Trichonephila clavipes]|nr:hypothetical protein TNCV_4088601 [Trichonephila clavipes]
MRDKSRKKTSSSKKPANGPDKISVALPRELAFIRPENCIQKIWIFIHSVFNMKLQKSKRRSWSPGISPAPGLDDKDMHRSDEAPFWLNGYDKTAAFGVKLIHKCMSKHRYIQKN